MSTPTTINEEYDIIIAGGAPSLSQLFLPLLIETYVVGGTAGCVIASRLATADPDLRILVLEAGPTTYNDPAHTHPMQCRSHLLPGSRTVRKHESRPSAALGGRSAIVHTGQCLGGGGSVNCAYSSMLPPFRVPFRSSLRTGDRKKKRMMMADFGTRMDG